MSTDLHLATRVRDAVLAVPGVARLAGGSAVEVATHYAGGKVVGVRLAGTTVQVHVVVDQLPVPPVADRVESAVREVLAAAGDPRPVQVMVDDVDDTAFQALAEGQALAGVQAPVGRR
ncbi:MAG: hypothetical protein GEV12_16385 [Micromonosporaceae bacterium]|nr:hypothetical protein [Micromonosporaceae bacterium]